MNVNGQRFEVGYVPGYVNFVQPISLPGVRAGRMVRVH